MPTLDRNKPVPIGLETLPLSLQTDPPASDDTVVAPPIDPVEGEQPEIMRFNAAEYEDFSRAFSKANLGNDIYKLSDFFRRDPESDDENPMYLYTGTPINAYGGYGKNKSGQQVKLSSGTAVHGTGRLKGQLLSQPYVVSDFARQLAAIDESK